MKVSSRSLSFFLKILLGVILIPGSLIASFWHLEETGFFNVERLEVAIENSPDSPQYLQAWMRSLDQKLNEYQGVSIWRLDLSKISQTLANEKWIEESSLTRKFPSQVQILIKPKKVESLLMQKAGKLFPVVLSGRILDPIDPRMSPDVPLISGEALEKSEELRAKAIQVLRQVPVEGAFSQKNISEVRYDSRDGFWMTLVKSGVTIKMGEDQIALKSERVAQVLDYMTSHSFEARVIDANLSKKVLVRLRKDP